MKKYSRHLEKITKEIKDAIVDSCEIDETKMNEQLNNFKCNTHNYIKEFFGNDKEIKYKVEISGDDPDLVLIDVKPKNLYTACKLLGFSISIESPTEGQAEFTKVTIMYDHIDGMSIIPKDPSDNLDDIIPIF